MNKYKIISGSGVVITSSAKTLTGAKREASAWITFEGGSVTVLENGAPVAKREFWRELNRFGWEPWQAIH